MDFIPCVLSCAFRSLQRGGGQHVGHGSQLADGRHPESAGTAADRQVRGGYWILLDHVTI